MNIESILLKNKWVYLILLFCGISINVIAQSQYRVTAQRVNVRASASTKGALVGSLNKGDTVTVTKIENNWATIHFKQNTRYVSARYIELIEPEEDSSDIVEVEPDTTKESEANLPTYQTTAIESEPSYPSPAKGRREVLWNLKGGGMLKTYDKDANTKENGIDWMAGIEVEIPLSDKWNIETGLRFKSAYRVYEVDYGNGYKMEYANGKNIGMLELPIRLAYKFPLGNDLMLHTGIGPYVSNDLFSNQTDTQVGIEPSVVLYWKNLNIGVNYDVPFYKSTNGSMKTRCATNNVVMLTLGIRFKSKVWKYVGAGALVLGGAAVAYGAAVQGASNYSGDEGSGLEDTGNATSKQKSNKKTNASKSCSHCSGTGICTYCNGDGYNYVAGNPVRCTACTGLIGKCKWCKGAGRK